VRTNSSPTEDSGKMSCNSDWGPDLNKMKDNSLIWQDYDCADVDIICKMQINQILVLKVYQLFVAFLPLQAYKAIFFFSVFITYNTYSLIDDLLKILIMPPWLLRPARGTV